MTDSNIVTITTTGSAQSQIASMTFTGVIEVGSGQTSYPTVGDNGAGVWQFTQNSDRQGDQNIANDWNNTASGFNSGNPAQKMLAQTQSDSTPEKLNLFFQYKMTMVSGETYLIWLGQGHYSTTNNWWIMSPNIFNTSPAGSSGPANFNDDNGTCIFTITADTPNDFTFTGS